MMKNNFENQITEALQCEQPEVELEMLVKILSDKGFTRTQIYQIFLAYQVNKQDEAKWQRTEDSFGVHPVMLILDRLNGWCNPLRKLLPEEPFE